MYVSEPIDPARARLSIIDLSAHGHRPMRSDDGRFVVADSGEIYDFREIRKNQKSEGPVFMDIPTLKSRCRRIWNGGRSPFLSLKVYLLCRCGTTGSAACAWSGTVSVSSLCTLTVHHLDI